MTEDVIKMIYRALVKLVMCFLLMSVVLSFFAGCNLSGDAGSSSTTPRDIPTAGAPKKRVALTFDDGPHNVRTKEIVDELAKYGYHATFFVVGDRVDGVSYNGKAGLLYAIEAGNEIGIHGYTHMAYYDTCSDSTYRYELSETLKAITRISHGYKVRLLRPVGGRITDERRAESEYSIIMWSVDSEDWKYKYNDDAPEAEKREKVNTIVNNVMSSVEDGSIILMHDIYISTVDAVKLILARLHAEGYEVVTVSELIGEGLQPGTSYSQWGISGS